MRRKLVLDRCYVRTGGLWLDIRIVLGTAVYLMGFSYTTVRRVMRLPDPMGDSLASAANREHTTSSSRTLPVHVSRVDPRPLAVGGGPIPCGEAQ